MGLEVLHKWGADAPAELGGDATKPRKRFKVTPRRRVPGPVELHSTGEMGTENEGASGWKEPVAKKLRKGNDPLKIWSSRERAVKAPCREGGWGGNSLNGGEDAGQSEPPSEQEDDAAQQEDEGEDARGGLTDKDFAVFLTAGLVDEELPEGGGPDINEDDEAPPVGKAQLTKGLANEERPDKAYTTERAKKNGLANASSGRILVTSPRDHFGPITAAHDPVNQAGVRVGSEWGSRLECRQWGVHMPPVAGISGQSGRGAQSVVVSGGYEDDEDHGWYFIYTGSGGRDLSGNKRTSKEQSKEQVFEKSNLALKVSCREGYPVRVVRSYKDRKSAFAPPRKPTIRYDGIYRVEKCWRKPGKQNAVMCRFLFVRCDNEPPPWDSDGDADTPHRIVPEIAELNGACDVFEREGPPAWDWKEDEGCWGWTRDPPLSQHSAPKTPRGKRKTAMGVTVVEYDAPSPRDLPPSASESGDPSEADSDDDVSNLRPAARAGQADVTPTREVSPAPDLSTSGTEPLEDVDAAVGQKPDDVSAEDADDVIVGDDSVSVGKAGAGSGSSGAEALAADVTGFSEPERACEGAQTGGLLGEAPSAGFEEEDHPVGEKCGVKQLEEDMLQAELTPEDEKLGEVLVEESGVQNQSGGLLPAVFTPDMGAETTRASSPLQPRKLQFSDVDANREEAPVADPNEQPNGGVKEQSSTSLPKALTPPDGSGSSGEQAVEAELPARPGDVAVDVRGGDQGGESEEHSAGPVHVETRKGRRKKELLAQIKSLLEVKSQLRARQAYLDGILSQKGPEADEGAPISASDDASGSEGAPASNASHAQPPAQPDVIPVSVAAALDVSKDADGVANRTGGTEAAPNDVRSLSPDALKAPGAESGEARDQTEGSFGRTTRSGGEKGTRPAIKGNSIKILGATVWEAGLAPGAEIEKALVAPISDPQPLNPLNPCLGATPNLQAVAGKGDGVIKGGSGAVPECLTPGSVSNESGSFRGVEPESPALPPSKRAKVGDMAAMSVGDPFEFRADLAAEPFKEPVPIESVPTQKADHSTEATGNFERELQNGASPELPPTPDQFEKARKKGEHLEQPGTRTSLTSRPDFQPGALTTEPGTGVGQLIAGVIVPAALACEMGTSAGQLGTGEGQLEADRSLRGSPGGSSGEDELERGRKNPDIIVRELMRVAQENEARCREMERELQEARETARAAEERARGSDERARQLEETARCSEERARESEKQARDGEARTRLAEHRAQLAEELTRLVDERARGAEKRARGAEERARGAEERARLAEELAGGAEERARGTAKRAWDNEMTGRALEKRARESEALAQEFEKRLLESEIKAQGLEERLRVSEGFAQALEAMKRETEERWAAEVVELKNTMERDREDFCEAAGCLLWGKDGSDGSMTLGDVTARGVVESVGALKGLVEDLEGCPGKGSGGLIERARNQLVILRTDLGRKQEEVGMLETMLDQSELLREELERTRGDGFKTCGGFASVQCPRECAIPTVAVAVQTDEPPLEPAGRAPGEKVRADVDPDRVVVSGLRAELDELKQEYAALVGLIQRDRG